MRSDLDAYGMRVGCVWNATWMQMGCGLNANGMRLECVWDANGMRLGFECDASGVRLECERDVNRTKSKAEGGRILFCLHDLNR